MFVKKNYSLFIIAFCFLTTIHSWSQISTTTVHQFYCPLSEIPIVEDFSITDPTNTLISTLYIQISTGYINGKDLLSLNNPGSHPNITVDSFNSSEGKLTLHWIGSGTTNYADLIAAVESVVFQSSDPNVSGTRTFSITIDNISYLALTDHYYEYIPDEWITWTDAKDAAEGKSYWGRQGYLVTITSYEEAVLAGEQAPNSGWIGGSDAEAEGVWKWVTGPEAGSTFWFGLSNGNNIGADYTYENWNDGEPNDWPDGASTPGQENYAHVFRSGKWNDYPDYNTDIQGYIVEYGKPGDLPLSISASTEISISEINSTEGSTCSGGNATLSATAKLGGIISWYDDSGNLLDTGNTYTTPSLTSTTTYYAEESIGLCIIPVIAIVYIIPTITSTTNTTICGAGIGTISAIASSGIINWYDALTGGNLVGTGTSFTSPNLTSTTTYYVDATENGCTTATRTPVTINVQYTPTPTGLTSQTFCDIANAAISSLTVNGTDILWYSTSTGGTSLNPTDILTNSTTYFASQTINGCESPIRLTVNVSIYETVTPVINVDTIEECDNISDGDDTNGFTFFDLTENEAVLLNGKNASDFTFSYFSDSSYLNQIINPASFENTIINGQPIYVRIFNNIDNSCFTDNLFNIQVNALPIISSIIELKQCDDDTDGVSLFNLTEANELISVNYLTETTTYYLTEAEAQTGFASDQITNFINYPNPIPLNDIVFARIENTDGCFRTAQINLVVGVSQIPPKFVTLEYTVCDDELIDSDKRNGIASFDFSDAEQTIKNLFPLPHNFTVKFYNNELDALAEINPIIDTSNHRNDGYPTTQNIYVRIDSDNVNACLGLGHHITLNVESLPTANPVTFTRQCDDIPTDTELSSEFDTSSLEADLLLEQTNVTVTYFFADGTPLTDLNGNPINSPFPALFRTISQTITARVVNNNTNTTNNTACDDSTSIEFIVDTAPVINPVTIAPACNDGVDDTDGFHEFDTSLIETTLLSGQTGMNVIYTDGSGSVLSSPLPNPFNSNTQTITVIIENPINTSCLATTTIDFIVNALPEFTVETPQIVCLNGPEKTLTFDTELEAYTYDWTDENGLVLATDAPSINVKTGGIYTITATNSNNCTRPLTIEVNESIIANIDIDDVVIVDDSENNSITITTTNLGIGDYEFAIKKMDEFISSFQDEPYFENLTPGIYTLFIQDKNDCGIAQIDVSVIGFPKFFTPNNDGKNDTWQIKGVSSNFYPTSLIYIFDRFGKLITKIDPAGEGWNGSFNGKLLTSTDYWFSVQLIDKDGNIREKRGHFSLVRR